ncbi:MAG: BCCT family transporter [Nitriliruptor sp.]|uniref:BCCT family transporter n=1 Tax=Nitriliruptor sp. TaxID=2448056 RepID=UPI0034A07977
MSDASPPPAGPAATTAPSPLVTTRRFLGVDIAPAVFVPSAALILAFVVFGVAAPDTANDIFGEVQTWIVTNLGWLYTLAVSGFLVFVLWVGLGRFGHVRLGPPDARPRYSYVAWFAMLFSAGMGIGVLFWSVAEPLAHFANPPYGDAETAEAARQAMVLTYLHWGLHGWAIYVVIGLGLALMAYRLRLPMAMRSLLHPLIGDRIYGPIGHTVDVFAILGTMFGVATTLGIGAQQLGAGLERLFGVSNGLSTQLWVIGLATLAATISVVSGLDRGIKLLSQAALYLGMAMLGFVLIAGPTAYALTATVDSIGLYLQRLPETAFRGTTSADATWMGNWTLFYWGWWLAWSPFVGMFVARVSRGRTVREFVLGVLLVPSLVIALWYGVFGNIALRRVLQGDDAFLDAAVNDVPVAIFDFFDAFPLTSVVSVVGLLVIVVYFVTSSDSAPFVIDMLASHGDEDPPVGTRVFWAISEGLVGGTLLVAGGLQAMRTFQITTGLPLLVLTVVTCVAIVTVLRREVDAPDRLGAERGIATVGSAPTVTDGSR